MWLVVFKCMLVPWSFCAPLMARMRGKRRNWGKRTHQRLPAAVARWPIRGGERLDRALCGLLARRPRRRVLLASAVKIFFQVYITETLVPAVLRDAACDGERHSVELFACLGVYACVLSFLC